MQPHANDHLLKSSIIQQKSFYVKVDPEGHTEIQSSLDHKSLLKPKCFYREVNDDLGRNKQHQGDTLFKDQAYAIDLGAEFGEKEEDYMLKRLSTLYGKKRPTFIDIKQAPTKFKDLTGIPNCLHEFNLYSTEHYRGFFLTQDFSKTGKYVLLICTDGKFETICVDDYIPIDKSTLLPIWGFSFDRPWELILLKAWAKHKGGYHFVNDAKPFQFVQNFSNPTWKYYNLVRQQGSFLNIYSNPARLQNAKIILKTKQDPNVRHFGLNSNSAGYQIIDICKHNDKYVIAVRSTTRHSWTGTLSYIDDHIISYYNEHKHRIKLTLDRDFLISQKDLNLLFSSAYITAKRETDFFTGSKLIEIPANQAKTHYYQFIITHSGFFDFSLKQFNDNLVQINPKANHVKQSKAQQSQRYLSNFLILVKDTSYKVQQHEQQIGITHINQISPMVSNLKLSTASNKNNYKPQRFVKYQIDYPRGYNRGDAKFLAVQQGRYILRFKSQYVDKKAKYELNWVSNNIIKPKQCFLSQEQKDQLLHQTFVDLIKVYPHFYLEKNQKNQFAVYGLSFQQAKYGFCGVKSSNSSTSTILMQCDPKKLVEEGYSLKGKYKYQQDKFVVKIEPGQFQTIVFKKRYGATKYMWPVKSINIFKKAQTNLQTSILKSDVRHLNTSHEKNIEQSHEYHEAGEKAQH